MSTIKEIIYDTDEQATFAHDTDEIQIDSNGATLKLIDDPLQENQPYDSDSGFTYDNTKAEFTSGVLRQIDNAPSGAISWVTYTNNINLNSGGGVLTGTSVGGAGVTANKLNLKGGTNQYVDYNAVGNCDSQQEGAIKLKHTPDYSGTPSNGQTIFTILRAAGDRKNRIALTHRTTSGDIVLEIRDENENIILSHIAISAWNPTSAVTYEWEVNFNLNDLGGGLGATRVFLDGNLQGGVDTSIGTRDSNIGLLRIGSGFLGTDLPDFELEDFIYFPTVQHTSTYTPGYTLEEARYLASDADLPVINYSGLGVIQSLGVVNHTGANPPTSTDSFDDDEIFITLNFVDGNTQQSITNTEVNFTGQAYPEFSKITPSEFSVAEGFDSVAHSITQTQMGATAEYQMLIEGTFYYLVGSTVTPIVDDSSTNTIDEWNDEAAAVTAFISSGARITMVPVLNPGNGNGNPLLASTTLTYNFFAFPPTCLVCTLFGTVNDNCNDITEGTVRVFTTKPINTQSSVSAFDDTVDIRVPDGFFEIELIIPNLPEVEGREDDTYNIELKWTDEEGKSWQQNKKIIIPNQATVLYDENIIQ